MQNRIKITIDAAADVVAVAATTAVASQKL